MAGCVTCIGIALAGCGRRPGALARPTDSPAPTGSDGPSADLKLATTTSVDHSGLLDVLLPAFAAAHGIRVDVIAVGTGKAIKLAQNGDVDVILVHAPEAERGFVEAGHGVGRRRVCHNDFVILGPSSDPAAVVGMKDATAALGKIAARGCPFVSRGDESGTHKKETALWRAAGVSPGGGWYLEAGQGMGPCLVIAHEKQAYVLADRGAYLAFRSKLDLKILVEGDERLVNPYSVIAVDPTTHPHVKHAEAMKLIEWLTSPEARKIIAEFKVGGELLFHPGAATPGGLIDG
ncbi:MAG: ABC transporter substrate-binding protein, partial [Planctomycetota bacterium]